MIRLTYPALADQKLDLDFVQEGPRQGSASGRRESPDSRSVHPATQGSDIHRSPEKPIGPNRVQ